MISVRVVALTDDLERIVAEINDAAWDDANEVRRYDVLSLAAYLERQDDVTMVSGYTYETDE